MRSSGTKGRSASCRPRWPPSTWSGRGPAGGVFADELFPWSRGRATIFVPCAPGRPADGSGGPTVVPTVELATVVHAGSHTGIDRAYGALGAYVAQHAVAMDGPIREYYLVGPTDTSDE